MCLDQSTESCESGIWRSSVKVHDCLPSSFDLVLGTLLRLSNLPRNSFRGRFLLVSELDDLVGLDSVVGLTKVEVGRKDGSE